MRVAFVAGTLGNGGAERQLFELVRLARGAGLECRVLCLTRGELWEDRIRGLGGVEVEWAGVRESRAWRAREVARRARAWGADVVQSQHFYTNLYAAAAGRALGVADVGALRSDMAGELGSLGRALGWLSLRCPRYLAANSRRALARAAEAGRRGSGLFLLPNAIDAGRFEVSAGRWPSGDRLVLGMAGRLARAKRVDRMLEAMARARGILEGEGRGFPWLLRIAGDGPERGALEGLRRELGLEGVAEFAGGLEPEAIPEFLGDVDLLGLSSDREGTPNAILEGMAAGRAALTLDVGGAGDLVEDGATGWVTAPERGAEGLAEALAELGRLGVSEGRRALRAMGEAARGRALSNHGTDRVAGALAALYGAATGSGSGSGSGAD